VDTLTKRDRRSGLHRLHLSVRHRRSNFAGVMASDAEGWSRNRGLVRVTETTAPLELNGHVTPKMRANTPARFGSVLSTARVASTEAKTAERRRELNANVEFATS
jgi:hypothetical protein